MALTANEIKAKTLSAGRALEKADWPNMSFTAAWQFCEDHARKACVEDRKEIEEIIIGAITFVMVGGSQAARELDDIAREIDEREIEEDEAAAAERAAQPRIR